MFKFFKKKKEKVHEKWFLFILSTVVVACGIGNELLKGTSATLVPVNEAFDDMSFYMCVVDAYNSENYTDYDYNYNLTDDELATITYMNCSFIGDEDDGVDKIKSTKGIEKLESLVDLELFEHEITSIDVSNNIMLENMYVSDNQLTELNVSGNSKLITLIAQNNKLTNIDLSNNVDLSFLDLSENQLTSIDLSNNINLFELTISDNQLTELNLSNNNKLKYVVSLYNSFSKTLNLYKGDTVTLESIENVIKLPSEMSQDLFSWLVLDFDSYNIIALDENNVVTALNGGMMEIYGGIDHEDIGTEEGDISYFLIDNIVNVVDMSSEEYDINTEDNYIYVGSGNIDINKIDIVGFSLNTNNNKLQILNEETLITELDILSIDFGELNVKDNVIEIIREISYNDFVSNITKSEFLEYKIKNNDVLISTDDNILDGVVLEVYYNEILLDSYVIKIISEVVNDVVFDENIIILDEENDYIKYKKYKLSVSEFLSNVTVSSDARVFISDVNGNEKNENDLVVTGDVFTIFVGSEKIHEYTISIKGDANGDGNTTLTDLVQVRKHIVGLEDSETGNIYKKEGIYFYSIDMNDDGNISLTDLVQIRKFIASYESE